MNEIEKKTIKAFFYKERHDRYLLLLGNKERRKEILNKLNHCKDLNPKFADWLKSNANIYDLLKEEGAPDKCYVISGDDDIDGVTMDLRDAIEAAPRGGWGTIISCIPGKLAYYYDELGERRAILKR
jgi:hypothetical protein